MIILVGGEKGGSGKTTLAVNLAAMRALAGHDVLLLDADPQGTASLWAAIRDEGEISPRVTCVQKLGPRLNADVKALASKFEDIIIDAGGRDSVELRSALLAANRFFTPLRPSQFDSWTSGKLERLVTDARGFNEGLEAGFVISMASPTTGEAEEVREFLSDCQDVGLSAATIRDRIAFRRSAREGKSVVELKPEDAKASAEMKSLYEEVFDAAFTIQKPLVSTSLPSEGNSFPA